MRKFGVTRQRIEPSSPWWKESSLTAQPLWPLHRENSSIDMAEQVDLKQGFQKGSVYLELPLAEGLNEGPEGAFAPARQRPSLIAPSQTPTACRLAGIELVGVIDNCRETADEVIGTAGIVPDDAAGRWVFSGIFRLNHPLTSIAAPYSPQSLSSALKTSLLRAAKISSLQTLKSPKCYGLAETHACQQAARDIAFSASPSHRSLVHMRRRIGVTVFAKRGENTCRGKRSPTTKCFPLVAPKHFFENRLFSTYNAQLVRGYDFDYATMEQSGVSYERVRETEGQRKRERERDKEIQRERDRKRPREEDRLIEGEDERERRRKKQLFTICLSGMCIDGALPSGLARAKFPCLLVLSRMCSQLHVRSGRGGVGVRILPPPPTRGTGLDSRLGHSRIFSCGNRAGRCRWSVGFLKDLPFPSAPSFRAASYSARFTFLSSEDLQGHENFANSFGDELDSKHLSFSPTVVIERQFFRHAPFNCEPRPQFIIPTTKQTIVSRVYRALYNLACCQLNPLNTRGSSYWRRCPGPAGRFQCADLETSRRSDALRARDAICWSSRSPPTPMFHFGVVVVMMVMVMVVMVVMVMVVMLDRLGQLLQSTSYSVSVASSDIPELMGSTAVPWTSSGVAPAVPSPSSGEVLAVPSTSPGMVPSASSISLSGSPTAAPSGSRPNPTVSRLRCMYSDETFANNSNVKRHEKHQCKMNSLLMAYKCEKCLHLFARTDKLDQHSKLHKGLVSPPAKPKDGLSPPLTNDGLTSTDVYNEDLNMSSLPCAVSDD
ncbi:hypothetical protein PR048_002671 [Dryococelus australis]|uniref:C2H2-type domain-containing protein n=1 Tax=Dryococelus australis TaxID=614101 RepID=A0ABQ9IMC0_9NEOP|nr:hypothetical protein PR048_002671 [Dryococelus australis]